MKYDLQFGILDPDVWGFSFTFGLTPLTITILVLGFGYFYSLWQDGVLTG